MADLFGEKRFETKIAAANVAQADEKLLQLLSAAGLVPEKMPCEIRRLTADGDLFEFAYSGKVKPAPADNGSK